MDRQTEITQCDQIIAELADLYSRTKPHKLLDLAREEYKKEGRGFLISIFASIDEAQDFIKKSRESGEIDPTANYLNRADAERINYPKLLEIIDEYDPQFSYIILIYIYFKSPPKDGTGRAEAVKMILMDNI